MSQKKEVFVFMDTGVSVIMDESVDTDSEEARSAYLGAFLTLLMQHSGQVDYIVDGEEELEEETS